MARVIPSLLLALLASLSLAAQESSDPVAQALAQCCPQGAWVSIEELFMASSQVLNVGRRDPEKGS